MTRRWLFLMVVALVGTAAPGDDKVNTDRDMLHGDWRLVSGRSAGQPLPKDEVAQWTLSIRGDTWTLRKSGTVWGGPRATRLDPAMSPKAYDQDFPAGDGRVVTRLGIYRLEGDTLTASIGTRAKRPADFDANCVVYERVRSGAPAPGKGR